MQMAGRGGAVLWGRVSLSVSRLLARARGGQRSHALVPLM